MNAVVLLVLRNVHEITPAISIPSCHHLGPIGSSKNARWTTSTPALFQSSDRPKLIAIWALIAGVISCTFLSMSLSLAHAAPSLAFKKEAIVPTHWYSYGLIFLLVTLIGLLIIVVFMKKNTIKTLQCTLKEELVLNQKTRVYLIEYQEQEFLLADNQQALMLHPLAKRNLKHD